MTDRPGPPDFNPPDDAVSDASPPDVRGGFHRTGQAATAAADWLADRIEDAAAWLANFVRYLPARVARVLGTLVTGLLALLKFAPSTLRVARLDRPHTRPFVRACARRGGIRAIQFVLEALDLLGTPEVFAFVWRLLTRTSPLTGAEIAAASSVLGSNAVRYQDIRVAQGGVLRWIFARNGQRAFATFHTINLPERGRHERSNTDIMVHEIIHVYQYERAGSRYFAEALLGQHEEGYDYGGPDGLKMALRQGKRFANFNREQQAQVAQDYYLALRAQGDIVPYEPFIRELRQGRV